MSDERAGGALTLSFRGELSGARCGCAEKFWRQRLRPEDAELTLDLSELEDIDAAGVAQLVELIRDPAGPPRVLVREAPRALAHVLYKTAALESGRVVLIDPRMEEPYVG